MTADLLEISFGAIFAAGHDPDLVCGWRWPRLIAVARSIRAYHSDLAASLMTGKSPALEKARTAARRRAHEEALLEQVRAEKPDASPEAVISLSRDLVQLGRLSDAGFAVLQTTSVPTVDLFKEFERRKRGHNPTG